MLVRFALTDARFPVSGPELIRYTPPPILIYRYTGYVADSVRVERGIYTPSISADKPLVVKERKGCRRCCPLAALFDLYLYLGLS